MTVVAGARLGPYQIVAPLGAGGMGEVYRARDTRLDRIVAIKVLPAALAADPQLRERFEREARAVSSLQHPHICALFDVGRDGEHEFLVLEYLEGETLAERLTRGALPPSEALRLALEICDALDRAHHAGIIHRDVKPANVMLVRGGSASAPPTAKLLDFGLAKAAAPAVTTSSLSMLPTTPPAMTAQGTILGTLQYMAPEQIEGLEADARTDIFAFGAVLFEMLTGRTAFAGKTRATVLSAILKDEPPPLSTLQPAAPKALDRIVATCLAKDPDDRYQSARDLLRELKWAASTPDSSRNEQQPRARMPRRSLVVPWTAVAALGSALFTTQVYRRSSTPLPVVQFTVAPAGQSQFGGPSGSGTLQLPQVAISPDGRLLAFVATSGSAYQLWIRPIASVNAVAIPGTEDASLPFWSADSRFIGFFAGGKLKKVDAAGGRPIALCDVTQGRGGTWNADNTIVFAHAGIGPLERISGGGGTPTAITTLDATYGEVNHRFPQFLPDGRHLIYTAIAGAVESTAKPSLIKVAALDGGDVRTVFASESRAVYASGHVLFVRDGTLIALPFDSSRLRSTGEAFPVADEVPIEGSRYASFSASDTGTLVYGRGPSGFGVDLTWFDRSGKELGHIGDPRLLASLTLSPDGRSVAATLATGAPLNRDVWVIDIERGVSTRLTFDPADDSYPVWSPDGSQLVFRTVHPEGSELKIVRSAGGAQPEIALPAPNGARPVVVPTDWSRDGRYVAYTETSGDHGNIWFLPLDGDRKPFPLQRTEFNEDGAAFSPDGHWVAYHSNESGSVQVHLQSFPAGRGKFRVSSNGGANPAWRGDGREIFFVAPDGTMMGASVDSARGFELGIPKPLFQTRSAAGAAGRRLFSVTRDGSRFLIATPPQLAATTPLTVVINWPATMRH